MARHGILPLTGSSSALLASASAQQRPEERLVIDHVTIFDGTVVR